MRQASMLHYVRVRQATEPSSREATSSTAAEQDEEQRSVTPTALDVGDSANVDLPDLSRHLLGNIQDVIHDMGLATEFTTYKQFAFSNIASGQYKEKLLSFLNTKRPDPDRSLVPIEAFASDNERSNWDTHCLKIDNL
ncbi:hypothetical protein H9Q72_009709 [Fusarium xylarioides]|uniref:Uncharacterized protein n=1 Tax=Fusarium xylarioides TaxID=221167 RepID=A0A9P7HM94_9HYPO|nr:hypothetical protein H9Q70_002997 [Fusarium xylarioides]KAG5762185.1 hypothetical protein H9Q72_009709 [Fusarium xylarioides]KAG5781870.1 hypothetical protein H9Q73_004477 [Fusarium xylarioides]KAG5816664.1 hypothetical protein H9Q71_002245 [Fusarium xylarioides]KAG5828477.1 hypothetical protein H9Q74_001452 [Fusarium xylarioides]